MRELTKEEVKQLQQWITEGVSRKEATERTGFTESQLLDIRKKYGIEGTWKNLYECVVCGKEFRAEHKSLICKSCKETPAKCIVCGKEFKRVHPYTHKTCSRKCAGIYRKESGYGKEIAAKMKKTKMDRYGTLSPAEVAKAKNGGQLDPKICKLCGKEFIPNTSWQVYCTDVHYVPCPVCGKLTELKDRFAGPQACSEECRMKRINATCLERYGNKDAVNSEHAKQLAKQHNLERYGVENPMQSKEVQDKCKQTNLERYGVEYPLQSEQFKEKSKQTNLERYGVEYYSQTDEYKEKFNSTMEEKYGGIGWGSEVLMEKIIATNNEKYGADFPLQNPELLEKYKQSNLEKYGTEWPATLPEVVERRKATNLEKYGAENPYGSLEIQEKIKELWLEKYGSTNPMHDPEIAMLASERLQEAMINKYGANASMRVPELKEKIQQTMMERYGVTSYLSAVEFDAKKISSYNIAFSEKLNQMGVETEFEVKVGGRSFDIGIKGENVVIEIDPTDTHNTTVGIWGPESVAKPDSQLRKTELAEQNGYRCIHVFDWDSSPHILALFKKKTTLYARKCEVMKIDSKTANIFTERYHLQGKCRGQNEVYGLYYSGELVELMSFGKPRYTKKEHYDFELLRLCTKFDTKVIGGASKLFSAFLKDHPNASVISYCDRAKFDGKVYEQLGMKLIRTTPPAKIWSKGARHITDNYLRQQGFDRIFHTDYGKGTSNEELIIAEGFKAVYDCGQKVFAYTPDNR